MQLFRLVGQIAQAAGEDMAARGLGVRVPKDTHGVLEVYDTTGMSRGEVLVEIVEEGAPREEQGVYLMSFGVRGAQRVPLKDLSAEVLKAWIAGLKTHADLVAEMAARGEL